MTLAVTEAEVLQLLAESEFMHYYQFQLHSLGDGTAIIRVPFQKVLLRPGGVISGPTYMAAADLAMWLAVLTKIGLDEGRMTVTNELNTAFLNGGRGDFLCSAKILKLGKRLIYGTVESVSVSSVGIEGKGEGKILSHHTVSYIRPNPKT